MRLKKITLNNFRCFKNLEIDLHPRLTIIVGENGAGKTAVLDGIAAAFSPVLTYLSSADQRLSSRGFKDSDFRIESWKNKSGKDQWGSSDYVQVIAEANNVAGAAVEWDYWRPSRSGQEPPKKYGEAKLKSQLQIISDSYKTLNPKCPPVLVYYGARRGFIEVPERLRESKENYRSPSAALIGALDSMSDFKEMLKWFDLEESAELRENKGVLEKDFRYSPFLSAIRSAISIFLNDDYRNPHFNKDHKFVLERKSDGVLMSVGQLSQGYQSMLALAMDFVRRLAIANQASVEASLLINAENLKNGICTQKDLDAQTSGLIWSTPAIMLIDEIDLHLHPSWQQRVVNDLLLTFPLTQFIVTTHSPQVLSTVRRDNIRVLKETAEGHEADVPDFSPLAHESGDALAKIMGTHREPELPLQESIRNYEQLVRSAQEDTPAGVELRSILDTAGYQIHDSDLATWRFLAQRQSERKKD